MFRPFFRLVSMAHRSIAILLSALACIGMSSLFFLQTASAMSEVNKMEVGEILVESTAGSLHCEIITQSVLQSLEMKAVVWSTDMATGSYSFVVTKQGISGRSNVAQSGLFEIQPSERKTVGTVMVNISRGDSYLARLSVRSGVDEVMCDTKIE